MTKPTATQVLSWVTMATLVIAAVVPVLPEGTPAWVHTTLLITATVLGVFTHKPGAVQP